MDYWGQQYKHTNILIASPSLQLVSKSELSIISVVEEVIFNRKSKLFYSTVNVFILLKVSVCSVKILFIVNISVHHQLDTDWIEVVVTHFCWDNPLIEFEWNYLSSSLFHLGWDLPEKWSISFVHPECDCIGLLQDGVFIDSELKNSGTPGRQKKLVFYKKSHKN